MIDLKMITQVSDVTHRSSVLFYRTWLYISSRHHAMFYTHNHQDVAVLWRRRHQHHGASCRHQPLDHSMGNHHPVRMDPPQNTPNGGNYQSKSPSLLAEHISILSHRLSDGYCSVFNLLVDGNHSQGCILKDAKCPIKNIFSNQLSKS